MCIFLILQQKGVKSVKYDKSAQNSVKTQQKTSTGQKIVFKRHRIKSYNVASFLILASHTSESLFHNTLFQLLNHVFVETCS